MGAPHHKRHLEEGIGKALQRALASAMKVTMSQKERVLLANVMAALKPEHGIDAASRRMWQEFYNMFATGAVEIVIPKREEEPKQDEAVVKE